MQPRRDDSVRRVVEDKGHTTIGGGGSSRDTKDIARRAGEIRHTIERTEIDDNRDKLRERLAKLDGGVTVIRIGAPAKTEMKARKEALGDTISATKAAVLEGIVAEGGFALLRCLPAVEVEERACEDAALAL